MKLAALIIVAIGVVWAFQRALSIQISEGPDEIIWDDKRRAELIKHEQQHYFDE